MHTAAQRTIARLLKTEYNAGRFNGTLLAVREGHVVARVQQGKANLQFDVPITTATRFPIASMTKLFTAILTLQLVEQTHLQLDDSATTYLPDLPTACRAITIRQLLTHASGLKNEPVRAYQTAYSTQDFVKRFVRKDRTQHVVGFNYNNVDYILLSLVLEAVTKQSFEDLIQANILTPLRMHDTGMLNESLVIPHLAYGYHNYSFGKGYTEDPLHNDHLYLSNYAGAGALYSTPTDLHKLVQGLQAHTLLSASLSESYLLQPQHAAFVNYARGYSTVGFFYNDRMLTTPILERRGSIGGFNSVLLTSKNFAKVLIILTNTDQADLEKLGDQIYNSF